MIKNEELLILYLYLPSSEDEKIIDPIRIMKGVFLICKEIEEFKDLYLFEPYLYGPCSFEIYSDLRQLMAKGIVQEHTQEVHYWSLYSLTSSGEKIAKEIVQKIPKESLDKISNIKQTITKLAFIELLRFIYRKYPDYAKKSIFNVLSPQT